MHRMRAVRTEPSLAPQTGLRLTVHERGRHLWAAWKGDELAPERRQTQVQLIDVDVGPCFGRTRGDRPGLLGFVSEQVRLGERDGVQRAVTSYARSAKLDRPNGGRSYQRYRIGGPAPSPTISVSRPLLAESACMRDVLFPVPIASAEKLGQHRLTGVPVRHARYAYAATSTVSHSPARTPAWNAVHSARVKTSRRPSLRSITPAVSGLTHG